MKTIGLLISGTTPGYRRYFTPNFVKKLIDNYKNTIILENGYGEDFEFSKNDYLFNEQIIFSSRVNILKNADIILSIISPTEEEIRLLKKEQILVAMLHYSTHPKRNRLIKDKEVKTVSLDSLKDYEDRRMIEDFEATAWNGVTAAFIQLRKQLGEQEWNNPKRKPIFVYQLGVGEVGKYVMEASLKMGNTGYQEELLQKGGNPLVEVMIVTSLHLRHKEFEKEIPRLLSQTNLLIDVTQRKDVTITIIDEHQISLLPEKSIILDISADRYDQENVVKAIQGIPTGQEDKIIFDIHDKSWTDKLLVPSQFQLQPENRRTVLSNYSWPNYGELKNRILTLEKYGHQLYPVIHTIIKSDNLFKRTQQKDYWSIEKAIIRSFQEYI